MTSIKPHRIAVLINDMNAAGGIQRMAANLSRDLQSHCEILLLAVEPCDAPAFHEPGLEFHSLHHTRDGSTRVKLLKDLIVVGLKLRRFVREQKIDTVLAICMTGHRLRLSFKRTVRKVAGNTYHMGCVAEWSWLRSKAYLSADAVVSVSAEDCEASMS